MTARAYLPAFSAQREHPLGDAFHFFSVCAEIEKKYHNQSEFADSNLLELASVYSRRIADNDWAGAKETDIATLIRAACSRQLKEFDDLRVFLLREGIHSGRANIIAAMCEGYLSGWKAGDTLTTTVAKIINRRRALLPWPYVKLVTEIPEVLNGEQGATLLAQKMLQQETPYSWLKSCGVSNPHENGLLAAASREFLEILPSVVDRKSMGSLMEWCCPDGELGLQGAQRTEAITHLLRPWIEETPQKVDKQYLTNFLVEHFGDPRVENPHIWNDVATEARSVLMRWLAGDSITAFMDVITAVEQQKSETWRMRREFWTQLYTEGVVTEAWVALHPTAEEEAMRRYNATGDSAYRAFAKQAGGRRDTSLLIMRAGNRIIVEGSHTYRVHVFDQSVVGRPQLYLDQYFDQYITLPKENRRDTWTHDIHGRWRQWVRKRIR